MMAAPSPSEDVVDDWVSLALKDDVAVVGVLLDIRHSEPPPLVFKSPALKLEWSVRQRRSRHVPRHPSDDVVDVKKKKKMEESTRASPATPLSWSGATSVSGGASEESSKPPKPTADVPRSKVAVTSCTTISRRPRKRKTLAQLKEEESFLLKERRNLKKELLTLRLNVEKQRATNESLKRIKVLQLQQTMMNMNVASSSASGEAVRYQPAQVNAVSEQNIIIDLGTSQSACPSNMPYKVHEEAAFPLPDLNLPFEEDHNSEALYGLS